jgi:hypothetical protein
MKRITKIRFVNYKAFYGSQDCNTINFPFNKNILIYGENGSGKSSLFEGLKQFFNSSDITNRISPSKNIHVPPSSGGTPNEVSVNVTFSNEHGIIEERTFGNRVRNTINDSYIRNANQLNSFFSYRELLKTYLMDDLKNRVEFRKKFAILLIETILFNKINESVQSSYGKYWEYLHTPRIWHKERSLRDFVIGLKTDINKINLVLNEILKHFDENLSIEIIHIASYIEDFYSERMERKGKYPKCAIDVKVFYKGVNVDNGDETHLTVLNEARLSALGISIYLAAIVITPQDNFEYKILFLDDIFIGLDMSNRLPLLRILTEFRKPQIERIQTPDGKINDQIRSINGENQYEPTPFFNQHQLFITTYDRNWFEIARYILDSSSWSPLEIYTFSDSSINQDYPIVISPSLNYYDKAISYFKKGNKDYPAAGNYLRKEFERVLKELLYGKYLLIEDGKTGNTEVIDELGQLWNKFYISKGCLLNMLKFERSIYSDFDIVSKTVLNPLSHDNLAKPIYKGELELAFSLIDKLREIKKSILMQESGIIKIDTTNAGVLRSTFLKLKMDLLGYKQTFNDRSGLPVVYTKVIIVNVQPIRFEEAGATTSLRGQPECDLNKAYNRIYHSVFGISDASQLPGANIYNEFTDVVSGQTLQHLIDNM